MKKFLQYIVICTSWLVVGCNDNYEYVADNGLDYMPVRFGKYNEYDVIRTNYSIGQAPDENHYIQRETVVDSFPDASGNMLYKLAFAVPDSTNWKTDSVNSFWFRDDQVLATEGGQTVVKLMLPLYERRFWDGNQYNTSGKQYFEVRNYKESFSTPVQTFAETFTVVRQYDSTLVSKKVHIEVYAKGVGLIKRRRSFVQYCNTPDCAGKGVINSGWEETSTLKDFEK